VWAYGISTHRETPEQNDLLRFSVTKKIVTRDPPLRNVHLPMPCFAGTKYAMSCVSFAQGGYCDVSNSLAMKMRIMIKMKMKMVVMMMMVMMTMMMMMMTTTTMMMMMVVIVVIIIVIIIILLLLWWWWW